MLKKLLLVAASTSCLILPQAAFAATGDTGALNVTLNVVSGCELAVGGAPGTENGGTADSTLDFGTVTVFGAGGQNPNDNADGSVEAAAGSETAGSANTFTVNCGTGGGAGLTPSIALNAGTHETGGQRFLDNGGAEIAYNLYQDAARSNPWVVDTPVALVLDGAGQAAIPIYGRATDVATTATADGAYNDTVTLTLTY